jgi:nucleotide-binding universal stress UspA family protein
MSQVLVVGIDCSDCSERALNYAVHWAEVSHARLIVVHVIEWSPFSFNTPQENEIRHKRREDELDRAHTEIVDPIVQDLRNKGVEAEGIIQHGHPAETLDLVAEQQQATNILIGRKGNSRIKTKLFGSVASTLVQISSVPVTVVP